jgi:Tol biopolymer transport system component
MSAASTRRQNRLVPAQLTALAVAALTAGLLNPAPAAATFAGKNGPIAFSYFAGPENFGSTNYEIATIVPGETPVALPAQNPRKDNWPDWSPDGTKIVWWHQGSSGNLDVFVMNANGSNQVNLTSENPSADLNAAWSPDGSEIVLDSNYQTDTGFSEIQVMDAGGTTFRQLTHNGFEFDIFGAFSPVGSRIAWAHDPDGEHSAIYTMDADDGGNVVQVSPDGLFASTPDWSPDGTKILFVDNACGPCDQSDIWVVNADGTNLKRLTNTPGENEFRPGWSPDGRKIVFSSSPLTEEFPDASLPADIFVMRADGKGRTNITNTPNFNERAADWGPRVQGGCC